jgi:hypothetical protein
MAIFVFMQTQDVLLKFATILEYLSLLDSSKAILSLQYNQELVRLLEKFWSTEKIFEHLGVGVDSTLRDTPQLWAGVLFFIKTPHTRELINTLYDLAITHPTLFTDIHNEYKRHPGFIENRHDQSILSILRKQAGTEVVIMPPTGFGDTDISLPIRGTRIRD